MIDGGLQSVFTFVLFMCSHVLRIPSGHSMPPVILFRNLIRLFIPSICRIMIHCCTTGCMYALALLDQSSLGR